MQKKATLAVFLSSLFVVGALAAAAPTASADSVAPEDAERFIALWIGRFQDDAFMEEYLGGETELDDGFGDLSEEVKRGLVVRLVEAYEAQDPRMYAMLNPTQEEIDATEEGAGKTREERFGIVNNLLFGVVFNKNALMAELRGDNAPKPDMDPSEQGASEFFPGMSIEEIAGHYSDQRNETMVLTDVDALTTELNEADAPELEGITMDERSLDSFESIPTFDLDTELTDAGFELVEQTPVTVPLLPVTATVAPLAAVEPVVAELANVVPDELVDLYEKGVPALPPELIGLVNTLATAATYSVCWQHASDTSAQCAELPGVLNVPMPIDSDGDGAPDLMVTITGPVSPLAAPDVSVSVDVRRVDAANLATPLPVLVYALYKLPGANALYAVVGLDGRSETLPAATTLTASVSDLLTDNPGLHLRLATGGAGSENTLIGGLLEATPDATGALVFGDSTLAGLGLSPVPAVFAVDFDMDDATRFVGTTTERGNLIETRLESTVPTKVTMDLIQTEVGAVTSARAISVVVADLPTEVEFSATAFSSSSEFVYKAATTIDEITVAIVQVPDVSDLTTFDLELLAVINDLPAEVRVEGGSGAFTYEASSAITQLTFATGQVENGLYSKLTAAVVDDIPTKIDVTFSDAEVDLQTNAPIGRIYFLTVEGRGPLLGLAGDHYLSYTTTTVDGPFSLQSAQISGLKNAHATFSDDLDISIGLVGGQPFLAAVIDEQPNGDGSSLIASISNLPSDIRVRLDGNTLLYEASDVISEVVVVMDEQDGANTEQVIGLIQDVPKTVLLDVQADAGQIRYEASSQVPLIAVAMSQTRPGYSQDFLAIVEDLPSEVRISFDAGDQTFAFMTDARLGRIAAQLLEKDGAQTRFALADVRNLPTQLVASWSGSSVDLVTDSNIGSVTVAASNFAGAYSIPGDGVLAYDKGGVQSIYAHVSKLAALHVEVDDKYFSLDFAQPLRFEIFGITDDLTAYVDINKLPAHLDIRFGGDTVLYRASSQIASLIGFYEDADQRAIIQLTGVPKQALIEMSSDPSVELFEGLGRLNFVYEKGASAFGVSGDHVVYRDIGAGRFAVSGQLSGIRSFSSELSGQHVSVDVGYNQPFTVVALTPTATAQVLLSNVPGHITVDTRDKVVTYSATDPINSVEAYFQQGSTVAYAAITRAPRLFTAEWGSNFVTVHTDAPIQRVLAVGQRGADAVSVDIRNIPSTMHVTWNVGSGSGSVTYDADGVLGSIEVLGQSGNKAAYLGLTGIPKNIRVNWGNKAASLWTSSQIGSIWAMATNDGGFSALSGDHALYLNRDSGQQRVSFRLSGLRGFSFANSGSTTNVNLELVGGQNFAFYALDDRGDRRMYVNGVLGPLPSSTSLSLGQVIQVSMNRNMDIQAYFEAGRKVDLDGNGWTTPAVESPYFTHGIVGRANAARNAVKATLFLTGLPTYVYADPDSNYFSIQNFQPRYNYIFADYKDPNLHARLYLGNPANNYVVQWQTGDKTAWFSMNANRDFGGAWAHAQTSQHVGYVSISNIPRSMYVSYSAGKASTSAYYSASRSISEIFVGYHRPWYGFYQAWVSIQDIPTYMNFNLGDSDKGPLLSYSASASTLDIYAYVDPSLFSGDFKARVYAALVNIGYSTSVYTSGSTYRIYSYPDTDVLYFEADIYWSWSLSKSGSWGSWWFGAGYHAYVSVYITIRQIWLYSEYLRDVQVRPELPTLKFPTMNANYFAFGWNSIYVVLNLDVGAYVELLGWKFINIHFHWYPRFYVWAYFTTFADHWYRVASACINVGWDRYCAYMDAHPDPHYRFYNSFALWRNEHGANQYTDRYVMINPFGIIPWWIEWAYVTFAKGGVRFGCC